LLEAGGGKKLEEDYSRNANWVPHLRLEEQKAFISK